MQFNEIYIYHLTLYKIKNKRRATVSKVRHTNDKRKQKKKKKKKKKQKACHDDGRQRKHNHNTIMPKTKHIVWNKIMMKKASKRAVKPEDDAN
jgi:hypothetical protein